MRITGYRTLTTVHDWGRPVGDANGVYTDGLVRVPLVVVETDEGITGVGLGPHVEIETVFAAIEGEDPRSVSALYDRMLRRRRDPGRAWRRPRLVGIAYACQELEHIEPESWDVALDYVVTEKELIRCRRHAAHGTNA